MALYIHLPSQEVADQIISMFEERMGVLKRLIESVERKHHRDPSTEEMLQRYRTQYQEYLNVLTQITEE